MKTEALDKLQEVLEARGVWCYRINDGINDELMVVVNGGAKIIRALPQGGLLIASAAEEDAK